MTNPDDVMKAAREISAKDWDASGCTIEGAEIRSGEYSPHEIEVIASALLEARRGRMLAAADEVDIQRNLHLEPTGEAWMCGRWDQAVKDAAAIRALADGERG